MKFVKHLLLLCALVVTIPAVALEEIDSVAIVVNDSIISTQEVKQRLNDFKRQLKAQGRPMPPEKLLKKQVVERMILDSIQLQMAQAQGIHVDELSLNRALESIAKNNRMSLDKMRRDLEKQGISYTQFREQTRKDIKIRQLQRRVIYSRIRVSEQEIDIFLDQQKQSGEAANDRYHLAHILIATPEAASPEQVEAARQKTEKVLSLLDKGKAFAELALEHSNGRHALKGGDLGWRSAAELPALFLDAARGLEKSQVSAALRSAGGFHILKLINKKTQQHLVKQTHARHILIKTDQITNDEQARSRLAKIRQRIAKGEDFAKLAREFSQDTGTKSQGGDLGWATEGTFVPRFTKVMNSLRIKQISEPFKSQFGWHIIQLLGRRQQDETQQVKRQKAQMAIHNRKADEELQLWLRRARDEAYIEIRIKVEG